MISNFIAVFYKASRQVPYKKGFVLRYNFINSLYSFAASKQGQAFIGLRS